MDAVPASPVVFTLPSVLTVAGSDCSGGAGIQADIKTITAHGLYAQSVLTAATAQNTTGVYGTAPLAPDFVALQLQCVFTDIFPDAVKIGMLHDAGTVCAVRDFLAAWRADHAQGRMSPIVLDPVLCATGGRRLLAEDALGALHTLIPLVTLVTPNLPEAEVLADCPVRTSADAKRAAQKLGTRYGVSVLVKGGHGTDTEEAVDVLWQAETQTLHHFTGPRIASSNTHGTGCTLSSAIACRLAQGFPLVRSVELAKEYTARTIAAGLCLGHGNGPLYHMVAPPVTPPPPAQPR